MICLFVVPVSAEEFTAPDLTSDLVFYSVPDNEGTEFRVTKNSSDDYILFLPAGADPKHVTFTFPFEENTYLVFMAGREYQTVKKNGSIDFTKLLDGKTTGELKISLKKDGESKSITDVIVTLGQSSSVDSMFLTSSDPVNYGRCYIEQDKENRVSGSVIMQNADGEITHSGELDYIKGRGNNTWTYPKRPYQIKLNKKDDLLDTGDKNNKEKKWILLANYSDKTLMANQVALELGTVIGLEYNMQYKPVDLYYDGEYRGSYLLTEKVEIGKGRVDIFDLEDANKRANEGVDLAALEVREAYTENGAHYSYCYGMKNPEDYSGGYVIEMDFSQRAQPEVCRIETTRGNWAVVKSPEYGSKEEIDFIAAKFQSLEDALYNGGTDPFTGRYFSEIVDLHSIAQCYLINEISRNADGFYTSSYLYLDKDMDKMKMGPIWDYDTGFRDHESTTELFTIHGTMINRMFPDQDFRNEIKNLYDGVMYPFLKDVLLSEEEPADSEYPSLNQIAETLEGTHIGDGLIWPALHKDSTGEQDRDSLKQMISKYAENMHSAYATWEDNLDKYKRFADVPTDEWFAEEVWKAEEIGLVNGTTPSTFEPYTKATRAQTVQLLYNMNNPAGVVYQPHFEDVPNDRWFSRAVTWAYEAGLIEGTSPAKFSPNAYISRQDVIVFLYRYYGEPEADQTVLEKFKDNTEISEYAKDAIAWAVANEIMIYTSETTLSPKTDTTRAELAVLFLRCYNRMGIVEFWN